MADPEDFLSESLQTLYDYAPIAHSSAGSVFTYSYLGPSPSRASSKSTSHSPGSRFPSLTISLRTPDTKPANWSLHASSIWASSLYIADHLSDLNLDRHVQMSLNRGECLRALELGAGAGLPGILIARLYDDINVVSSDYPDESLISTLSENVEANEVSDRCHVIPYAWGSDPATLSVPFHGSRSPSVPGFDIVIAADTLWNPELHGLFIETLCMTLKRTPEARIYLVAGLHTGRYTIQAFLRGLPDVGLEVEEAVENEANGAAHRPWHVERDEQETEEDRRRWVVWMVLRWKLR